CILNLLFPRLQADLSPLLLSCGNHFFGHLLAGHRLGNGDFLSRNINQVIELFISRTVFPSSGRLTHTVLSRSEFIGSITDNLGITACSFILSSHLSKLRVLCGSASTTTQHSTGRCHDNPSTLLLHVSPPAIQRWYSVPDAEPPGFLEPDRPPREPARS